MLPRASRSAHVGNPKLEARSQTDLLLFREASTMPLERELAIYSENLMDLLTSEGKYVVVHGETIQGPFDTYEDALQAGGGMPKSLHAALRLDCFLVDVCVTLSSCWSSTFNSARHSGGVQRHPVRRSLAIASRVCSTISSHRPDTTAARSWNTASALPSVQ